MIKLFTGKPGSGKTLMLADELLFLLKRNKRWYKKTNTKRLIYSNIRVSPLTEKKYKDFIKYWVDPSDLIEIRDADVIWDEIATHLDSTEWKNISLDIKRWLQQHRKFGVNIYGTTQDFAMIDISMRRMTSNVFYLYKVIGNSDPSPTRPVIKFIWGATVVRKIDPVDYKEDEKKLRMYGFSIFLITKGRVNMFNTREEIKAGKNPPLKHSERECLTCGKINIYHQ